jgi:AraC-like DNA-binding protein
MSSTLSQFLPGENESFVLKRASVYHALNDLHSHPELELIHITEGAGTLIIGDSVLPIAGGELILIGRDVPHMFRFQEQAFIDTVIRRGEKSAQLNLLLLHFDPGLFGEHFINVKENRLIKSLLQKAANVLLIEGTLKSEVLVMLEELAAAAVHEKLIRLMTILNRIGENEMRSAIASGGKATFSKSDESRLSKIFLVTINNFHRRITLKEMAEIVYMAPNAFCNYFKLKTGRPYFDFLLEVRVNHACKLLRTADHSIGEICYFSGFTNVSNFNRQFKGITGVTPLEYKKQSRLRKEE